MTRTGLGDLLVTNWHVPAQRSRKFKPPWKKNFLAMSALIRQHPKPRFRKLCVDAIRSIWAMTAFTASRAPETTADNNAFGGEGVGNAFNLKTPWPSFCRLDLFETQAHISEAVRAGRGHGKDRAGAQRPPPMATMTVAFPAREGRLYWNLTISRDWISQLGIKE